MPTTIGGIARGASLDGITGASRLARLPLVLLLSALLLGVAVEARCWTNVGVVVNGVSIPSQHVQILEQQYGVRLLDGDYWYDSLTGAWGYRGGPAAGLIHPFLNLGGPLRPDASNGNTNVFINGRELHIMDVRALQQITSVMPGRYWCDAMGNIGLEGGPALANLWHLANAASSRGVRREGILSVYDKTGAVVIGNDVLIKR